MQRVIPCSLEMRGGGLSLVGREREREGERLTFLSKQAFIYMMTKFGRYIKVKDNYHAKNWDHSRIIRCA
jgi:hypothetical protein